MKIAIHKSSWGFSSEWINYCEKNNVPFKIVNCYDSDIISQIEDCDVLLWHHHHSDAKDVLFAKGVLFALEQAGKKVFPEFNSGWHFDDKVGQKYLLEAIDAPMAKTWVFYEEKDAFNWIEKATFPKVFKLRGGAGSANVKLIRSKSQAQSLVKKAFGSGFPAYDKWNDLKEQYLRFTQGKLLWKNAAKSVRRVFVSTRFARTVGNQKGYVYFQEFIPNNDSDIRVITIGDKAFAIKRMTRPNDFRASGGGVIKFEKDLIDERCIKIAFETSEKMKAVCVAYDFVFDAGKNPLIVEINYGFAHEPYLNCPGYWDKNLNWHEGKFNQVEWILEEYLK
ncbi:MAG: ATP-grasp domain-containing protein [Flavobacterium sp.]